MPCTNRKDVFRESYSVLLDEVKEKHEDWTPTKIRKETAIIFRPRYVLDKTSDVRESSSEEQYSVGKFELRDGDVYFPQYDTTLEKLHENNKRSTTQGYSPEDHATSRALTEALRQGATDIVVVYGRGGNDNRDIIRYVFNPSTGVGEIWAFNTAPNGKYHSFEDIRHIAKTKFTGYSEIHPAPASLVLTDKKISFSQTTPDVSGNPLVDEKKSPKHAQTPTIDRFPILTKKTEGTIPGPSTTDTANIRDQRRQTGKSPENGKPAEKKVIAVRTIQEVVQRETVGLFAQGAKKEAQTVVYPSKHIEQSVQSEWQQAVGIRSVVRFAAESGVGIGVALYGLSLITQERSDFVNLREPSTAMPNNKKGMKERKIHGKIKKREGTSNGKSTETSGKQYKKERAKTRELEDKQERRKENERRTRRKDREVVMRKKGRQGVQHKERIRHKENIALRPQEKRKQRKSIEVGKAASREVRGRNRKEKLTQQRKKEKKFLRESQKERPVVRKGKEKNKERRKKIMRGKDRLAVFSIRKEKRGRKAIHTKESAGAYIREEKKQRQKKESKSVRPYKKERKTRREKRRLLGFVKHIAREMEKTEKRSAQKAEVMNRHKAARNPSVELPDTVVRKRTERKLAKRGRTLRIIFALSIFAFFEGFQKREGKRNSPQATATQENRTQLQQRELSTWILLAIIWYLAAIREHGKRQVRSSTFKAPVKRSSRQNHVVSKTTGHRTQLPTRGVIFLARS